MRSHKSQTITSDEVQSCVSSWLSEAVALPDHGWKCTAAVVWMLLIRAADRQQSVSAACRDLKDAPSDQAMLNALHEGLPKSIPVPNIFSARLRANVSSRASSTTSPNHGSITSNTANSSRSSDHHAALNTR